MPEAKAAQVGGAGTVTKKSAPRAGGGIVRGVIVVRDKNGNLKSETPFESVVEHGQQSTVQED